MICKGLTLYDGGQRHTETVYMCTSVCVQPCQCACVQVLICMLVYAFDECLYITGPAAVAGKV